MTITFGSLFAGIGGFDLGFERCGMQCRWQVEIDDFATRVLTKHWPSVHRERDIRQCGRHNLEAVDIICGGFPCQDISYAGHGAGLDGERSGLFFEAVRVVQQLRPRAVVLENVAALLTRGLDRVLGTLAEVGYDAEWHCIPAAAVGAPHIRDRVFVMAYAAGSRRQEGTRLRGDGKSSGRRKSSRGSSDRGEDVADAQGDGLERQRAAEQQVSNSRRKKNELERFCHSVRAVQWAIEPAVGRVVNGIPDRMDRLRGLGNAVVPQVAEFVGKMVLERLNEKS